MRRKIKRILIRLSVALFMALLVLITFTFFAVQSQKIQTWLAVKASTWLSKELHTSVSIDFLKLKLFRDAELRGLLVLDQRKDTLFYGDAQVKIRLFDLRGHKLEIESAELRHATSKVIRYRGDSVFNYQFLADYFDSGTRDTSTSPWDVTLHNIVLKDVSFVYRIEERSRPVPGLIDYDDIAVRRLNGTLADIEPGENSVRLKVRSLSAEERSGFLLRELSTEAVISDTSLVCEKLRIHAANSLVEGSLRFDHRSWDDYEDFIEKVNMDITLIEGSGVTGTDISYFAKELKGLDTKFALRGRAQGSVRDLRLKKFKLAFGKESLFLGDIDISGLPDTESSFFHISADALTTNYEDLRAFPAWPFHEGENLPVPQEIARLGTITYRGKLDGFLSDFSTYGTLSTGLGAARSQLSIRQEAGKPIEYSGRLRTQRFNAGSLLRIEDLGSIDMDVNVRGKGLDIRTMEAELNGAIEGVVYNNYRFRNINVNGTIHNKVFEGLLVSKDPNADFDFNGTISFEREMPEMDFISTINTLKLHALNFKGLSDTGTLSTKILIDITGDNIDNLSGLINLDKTVYKTVKKEYSFNTINILLDQSSADKKINLRSEYITALMHGKYELSSLPGAFKKTAFHYYPTFFKRPVKSNPYSDQFTFNVQVRNLNNVIDLFVPGLRINNGSHAEAEFDAAQNKLNLQLSSGKISYKDYRAEDLLLIVNERDNAVLAELSGKALRVTDSLGFRNFDFMVNSNDMASRYTFEWDNLSVPANRGTVTGKLSFEPEAFLISNEKIRVTINDSAWTLSEPNDITIYKSGNVQVNPMRIVSNNQSLSLHGKLSDLPSDSLVINLGAITLSQFNPLLKLWMLDLAGNLNGHVALSRASGHLAFNGNLAASDLSINGNLIGALDVQARYYAGDKEIKMRGFTSLGLQDEGGRQAKNITFKGVYFPEKREESLDFTFDARPANLKMLNPYLTDILTIKHAFVNGEGTIRGTPENVKIDGKFRLFNSDLRVDYTNVTYNVTGLIEVMPDQIRFSDLLMREKGSRSAPQGTVNGNIFHRNFGKMQLDYDITYRNMLVMNTTERENKLFYGKLYGSGNVGIYGFVNDLHMVVADTTKRNSQFVLPLDGPSEVGENDFIRFVKKDTVKTKERRPLTGFDLDMRIRATPDALVQIILDKQHGDMLNARGAGDLSLRINTLGKFEMFGDYEITEGSYLFTLENVINKKFEIEPGSSISWSGDPYRDAEIDVVTSYRQRTSIAPLLGDTSGQYKGRVPVDCKLLISGRLSTPQIKFLIDFPSADANAKARIASVLSDETELNKQVFSFLLFRSFVTPQIYHLNGGGVSAGGAAASTGSEMLSNRVSDFLNTYVGNLTGINDLQLGLNYRPGTQAGSDAVDLALSKQFLNNKITVDGNFGVNNSTQTRNSGGLIGDVNVDYKLSEDGRYRLKGFNRSNDNTQITTAGGPYTQGIGFFYREEFETFQQLLKRYLRKKRSPAPPQP